MFSKSRLALYTKNFVFGVEDSIVSTTGLLSGIAIAEIPKSTILLTGIILILVEAFSMGIGSFLSEDSVETLLNDKTNTKNSTIGALIMFISYLLSGLIPLSPYIFLNRNNALLVSVFFALATLFILGIITSKAYNKKALPIAIKMLLIGGSATAIGVIVGKFLHV